MKVPNVSDIRYNSGGLGKHKKEKRDMLSINFEDAFKVSNLDLGIFITNNIFIFFE